MDTDIAHARLASGMAVPIGAEYRRGIHAMLLMAVRGSVPRGVCQGPHFRYKCASPRLSAELPPSVAVMDKAHVQFIVPPRAHTLWHEGAKLWIGKPCTVLTVTVAGMGSPFRKGIWSRTGPAVGSRGRGVQRVKRVWS